jgi:predicted nucleic acid-binding protein
MRAAVADTSPLRYLVLINAIEVLPRLFEGVFVPDIVLERAAQRGLTDLPTAFAALKATNFHVRQELLDALLARHQERNPGHA